MHVDASTIDHGPIRWHWRHTPSDGYDGAKVFGTTAEIEAKERSLARLRALQCELQPATASYRQRLG